MKESTVWNKFCFWFPVYMRAGIIISLAMLTVLISQLDNETSATFAEKGPIEYFRFSAPIVIVGLTTLKGFLDDAVGKKKTEQETQFFNKP